MDSQCEIEVLVSTIGADGLQRLAASVLPQVPGVRYTIGCQQGNDDVRTLMSLGDSLFGGRNDMSLRILPGHGLSRSRNMLLDAAVGDILIFADDDIDFNAEAFNRLRDFFRMNPEADIIKTRLQLSGRLMGGPKSRRLSTHSLRGVYAPSCSLLVRRQSLGGLHFCEKLGLGTNLPAGEDDVFMCQAIRSGLVGFYTPIQLVVHKGLSTNEKKQTAAVLRARGLVLSYVNPRTWRLRAALLAHRLCPGKWRETFRLLSDGARALSDIPELRQ